MDIETIDKVVGVLRKDKHPRYAERLLDECCTEVLSWHGYRSSETQRKECVEWARLYDKYKYGYCSALTEHYLI